MKSEGRAVFGIDLGGTKIEGAVLDPEKPEAPFARLRVPTNAARGYEHIVDAIATLCRRLSSESGIPLPPTIGMGTPGVLDPSSGCIKNANTQCLNGRRLKDDVEKCTGVNFVLANDANCFALAEATLGAARGFDTVFGVILGTGVGGGLVVHRHVLTGRHGIAGEWGQIVIEPDGELSGYGTRGIIETILAGPALERFYAKKSGISRPLKEIVERTATGDRHAEETIARLTDYFAKAVSIVIDVFDPHAIVIGGGVGNIDALYTDATREKIAGHIFNPTFEAALLKPTLGDSAGVFGAAMLVQS